MPKVVLIGCGFLGEATADLFFREKWQVLGVCGTEESAARLAAKPYEILATDISKEFTLPEAWMGADVLVHCASSGRGGPEAYRAVYLEGLLNSIAAVRPRRVVFTSSTSVYAQTHGEQVDETSVAKPDRETGRILREAEQVSLASGGYALRLSGLYGPGRSILMRKFLAGEATLEGGGHRFINQIHRDDAASAIVHLISTRAEPGIFNVSDNTPAMQRDVYGWLADFFQKPLPPTGEPDLNRKRGWTNKRVSNGALRDTGWNPQYPSYREAIPSLAAEGC